MVVVLAVWYVEYFDGFDLREYFSRFFLFGNRKLVRLEFLIYMFDYILLDGVLEIFEQDMRGVYLVFESGLLLMIDKGKKGVLSVVGVEKKNCWFVIKIVMSRFIIGCFLIGQVKNEQF